MMRTMRTTTKTPGMEAKHAAACYPSLEDDDDEDDEDDNEDAGDGGKACGRLLSELLEEDDDDLSNAGLGAEGDSFQELAESDPLYSLDLQNVASTYFAGLPQGSLPAPLVARIAAGVREAQCGPA